MKNNISSAITNNKVKKNKAKTLFLLIPLILAVIITVITSHYEAHKYQNYDKSLHKAENTVHLRESGFVQYSYSAYAIAEDGNTHLPLYCHETNAIFFTYSCETSNKQLAITFRRGKGLLNDVIITLKHGSKTNKIKNLTVYHDDKNYYYVPKE